MKINKTKFIFSSYNGYEFMSTTVLCKALDFFSVYVLYYKLVENELCVETSHIYDVYIYIMYV